MVPHSSNGAVKKTQVLGIVHSIPAWEVLSSLFQLKGSVIPRSLCFALPAACIALTLKLLFNEKVLPGWMDMNMIGNNAAYTGFSFAMGFVFVFRTSQAYNRYWEGLTVSHQMYQEWMNCVGSAVAFGRYSKASPQATTQYFHRLIRLASLLHASASATLRGIDGSNFELIDIAGLEDEDVDRALVSGHPTHLIGQWVLELIMEGIEEKILTAPPPIISRAFQEFANGMVAYHDAMKIQTNKFPFPYHQMSAVMLITHWCVTPFVMCQWVVWPSWVFLLTLIQVGIFWGLYFTAAEIEFPFAKGEIVENDSANRLHMEFNQELLVLLEPQTRLVPRLSEYAILDPSAMTLSGRISQIQPTGIMHENTKAEQADCPAIGFTNSVIQTGNEQAGRSSFFRKKLKRTDSRTFSSRRREAEAKDDQLRGLTRNFQSDYSNHNGSAGSLDTQSPSVISPKTGGTRDLSRHSSASETPLDFQRGSVSRSSDSSGFFQVHSDANQYEQAVLGKLGVSQLEDAPELWDSPLQDSQEDIVTVCIPVSPDSHRHTNFSHLAPADDEVSSPSRIRGADAEVTRGAI